MKSLPQSEETFEVFPGVIGWSAFSPEHRVELGSHAVLGDAGWVCFDPIALSGRAIALMERMAPLHVLVLTNGNHERSVSEWMDRWQLQAWVPSDCGVLFPGLQELRSSEPLGREWKLHPLPGGGPGETAFRFAPLNLVIVGDAIVNLEGRRLEILPEKYCSDPGRLRESLRTLASEPFERLVMAHGRAVREGASGRILSLLDRPE
jgi:hypothetical protein